MLNQTVIFNVSLFSFIDVFLCVPGKHNLCTSLFINSIFLSLSFLFSSFFPSFFIHIFSTFICLSISKPHLPSLPFSYFFFARNDLVFPLYLCCFPKRPSEPISGSAHIFLELMSRFKNYISFSGSLSLWRETARWRAQICVANFTEVRMCLRGLMTVH